MNRQYKSIKEITLGTRGWTCKVLVAEKAMPRTSRHSPVRYQRLILIDHEGTRIQATIMADAIELFENTLKISKSYYISNAYIRPINREHRIVDNELQWTINNYTLIEEVLPTEGEKQNCCMYKYNFHQLDDLEKYINSDAQLDIVALVFSIEPIRTIQTRNGPAKIQELVLIDQKLKPQVLTMWDQFVDNECAAISEVIENKPIIIGTRLKVSTYNGLSFSTKLSSSFIINPLHIPEALELHKWSIENESCLKSIKSEKSHFTLQFGLTMPNDEEIVTIDAIQKLPEEQTNFWLKASISITNMNQHFWYIACEKCHKTTTSIYNDVFSCNQCKRTSKATPRCRFEAQLTDKTGSLVASLFAENAEKFLNCSAKELMENNCDQNNKKFVPSFCFDKEFIIYIKTNKNEYNGGTQFKYNVVSFYDYSQECGIKAAENVFPDKEGDTSTHVSCSEASIGNA